MQNFKVPEFEVDTEHWELVAPESRGLFYHKNGDKGELHIAAIIGGSGKNDGMLVGTMERYRYKHSDPKMIGRYGKMMKIFGVRIEKWWGLDPEDLPAKPFPMCIVWSGRGWVFCKPGIVKIEFEFDTKGAGAGDAMWAWRARIRVSESDHTIFKSPLNVKICAQKERFALANPRDGPEWTPRVFLQFRPA
jgi:hypothetical protein